MTRHNEFLKEKFYLGQSRKKTPEAEFLDEIQTKVLRVFLLAIHRHLYSFA
jgi:hypothetical protein